MKKIALYGFFTIILALTGGTAVARAAGECEKNHTTSSNADVAYRIGCGRGVVNGAEAQSGKTKPIYESPEEYCQSDPDVPNSSSCITGGTKGISILTTSLNSFKLTIADIASQCESLASKEKISGSVAYLLGCQRAYFRSIADEVKISVASYKEAGTPVDGCGVNEFSSAYDSQEKIEFDLGCAAGFKQLDIELMGEAPDGGSTAPDGGSTASKPVDDPHEIDTVADVITIIDRITNWIFTIFIAASVIMILMAAFKYLTAGGGEETAKAHKMLMYSAVAIAVAILAKGLVAVVQSILKL